VDASGYFPGLTTHSENDASLGPPGDRRSSFISGQLASCIFMPYLWTMDRAASLRRLALFETLLDRAFQLPVVGRVGLDSVIGLIPVVGDAVAALMGTVIVVEAKRLGAPRWLQMRMLANLALDTGLGAVPLAGDLFDVFFKSNTANMKLLRAWIAKQDWPDVDASAPDWTPASMRDVTPRPPATVEVIDYAAR